MSTDELVFVAVLALRLLVPLAIPYVPLPAILAALVIDGVDRRLSELDRPQSERVSGV